MDWLNEAFREWGICKKRILAIPPQPRSIFGRIASEGSVGAAIRGQAPAPPEVMLGIGLLVSRAIRTAIDEHALPYEQHEILHAHHVYYGPPRVKAKRMKIPLKTYYQLLTAAHNTVEPYIVRLSETENPL
jgi:hypothetical protein